MKVLKSIVVGSFIVLAFAQSAFAYVSPGKPVGHVDDFANVLTPEQRAALENKVGNFARPAGVELAIVTVPSLGDETIESYAVQLFQEWGIGSKLKDNGLLILLAPTEKQARIEVGYGLEGVITDAMASVIVNKVMVPEFAKGDYYAGLDKGSDSVMALIEGDPELAQQLSSAAADASPSSAFGMLANVPNDLFGPLVVFLFIIGLNLLSVMARSRSWWLGGVIGLIVGFVFMHTLIGAGICALVGLVVDFVLSRLGDRWPRGPLGPGGFWLFGGMGGRGGGFGGFGGGRSGGGGASGGW